MRVRVCACACGQEKHRALVCASSLSPPLESRAVAGESPEGKREGAARGGGRRGWLEQTLSREAGLSAHVVAGNLIDHALLTRGQAPWAPADRAAWTCSRAADVRTTPFLLRAAQQRMNA
eukprot:5650265-Pleurochrysis_carterae.AAC.2